MIKSIGYKSIPMPGIPFDHKRNVVPQAHGCILNEETGEQMPGLYVAGWAKRGPNGIIDATLRDSMDTFKFIKHHLDADMLPAASHTVEDVYTMLNESNSNEKIVNLDNWKLIKQHEIEAGKKLGKLKEKILSKNEMLGIG